MSPTHRFRHAIMALGSFSAALASLLISVKMGALEFIKENFIDGLCVDVWEGFFLSSTNLIAIGFLFYLPIHCYTNHSPFTIQFLSSMMAIPSYLFFIAMFLEISPVALPVGTVIGLFLRFGLSQYRLLLQAPNIPKKKLSVTFSPQLQLHNVDDNRNQSFKFKKQNIPAVFESNLLSRKSDFITSNSASLSSSVTKLSFPHTQLSRESSIEKLKSSSISAISKRKRRES